MKSWRLEGEGKNKDQHDEAVEFKIEYRKKENKSIERKEYKVKT